MLLEHLPGNAARTLAFQMKEALSLDATPPLVKLSDSSAICYLGSAADRDRVLQAGVLTLFQAPVTVKLYGGVVPAATPQSFTGAAVAAAESRETRAAALLRQTEQMPGPDANRDAGASCERGPECEPEPEYKVVEDLALGEEVQLLEDPAVLRAVFARFFGEGAADDNDNVEADEYDGWITEVELLARKSVGVIVEVFEPDRSVTLRLVETGELLECPFEAIARKTGLFDPGFEWARQKYTTGQNVHLISDADAFREAFSRFDGDEDENDWSPAKQQYMGWPAEVVGVYDDKTLTLQFTDGVQLDFPFEAIDLDRPTVPGVALTSLKTEGMCTPCGTARPFGRIILG